MNTQFPEQQSEETGRFRRIGFLVYPDCEILDVCGPFEAFYFADDWLSRLGKTAEPGYRSIIMAAAPGPVRTMSGMEIVATHGFAEISDGLDTLVVAGGLGVEQACRDEALVEWVRSMAPRARRVASICSGAFMLAAAGLLHRRRVTTHWLFANLLAAAYPSIEVDASRLFVRDGNIYTSGESPRASIWRWPWWRKTSGRKSCSASLGQWSSFHAVREDSPSSAHILLYRRKPVGRTSANFEHG